MKGFILKALSVIVFLWSSFLVLVAIIALGDTEEGDKSKFYPIAGALIIGFVLSWFLWQLPSKK